MFRGHFEGASSRPHQLLARAIFTPSLLESQQQFASLGLFKMEPPLFVAALEAGENIEIVIEKLANPDLAPHVREWLLNPASRPAGSTTLGRYCESLQRNQGGFTTPSTPMIEEEEVKFVEPRPILAPRPPLLGLEGLLDDFLSLSSPRTPLSESGAASSLDASDASDNDDGDDDAEDVPLVPRVEDWWLPMTEDMPAVNTAEAEPFYTVYFRVMGARLLASRLGPIKRNHIKERVLLKKIDRFIEAHTLLFHWIHQRGPLTLTHEHLVRLYRPLGIANMYACDRPLIRVERTAHVLRERPLVILKRRWPALFWEPELVPLDQLAKLGTCPRIVQPNDGGWVGWAPFVENVSLTTHRLYYGVVWVLNQCMRKLRKAMATETERYALWVYYVSWVDLFHYCLTKTPPRIDDAFLRLPPGSGQQARTGHMSYGDTASPWALYGTCDTRTFCAGDLPDFFHVLVTLPLWGEQQTPPYFLGKLYQKALPFAGARRHIVKLAIKCILDHPVFWRVFSRLMWVMLANLYPGDLAGPYDALGMRSLLRIKELCENRDLLIGTLIAYQPGMGEIWIREEMKTSRDPFIQMLRPNANRPKTGVAANGGPLIVATMFRMHILYMGHFNPTYVEQARRLIDWDYHKAEAVRLSSLIRQRGLFAQDAFAQARAELSKTVKSPHSHVHRIRRHSIPMMVQEKMNDVLEKLILRNRQIYSKDAAVLQDILSADQQTTTQVKRFFAETKLGEKAAEAGIDPSAIAPNILALAKACAERSVEEYNQLLDLGVKSAIQNALLHVMPRDRLTKPTFAALLMKPEYGAISAKAVEIMWRLVLVAADKAAPKDFARYIGALDHHDFLVATYYFNVVAQLDNIHFVALDAETIAQTHDTMVQKRYQQEPDDEHDESMYEIAISLCCNRICAIMGQDKFGSRRVALDLERGQLVCVHSKPPRSYPLPGNNQDIVIDHAHGGGDDNEDAEDDDDCDDNNDHEDDDEDGEDDDAGDTDHPVLHQVEAMAQEDEMDEEALFGLEGGGDLLGDAIAMGGKGTRKARLMQDRKQIRNQRKQFNKVPCGQPVLVISLRGRALLWGNQLDKRVQIMFCPTCGGLHMYTVFGWSMLESDRQRYRCAECMRSELTHVPYIVCAYCGKNATPECVLNVMCPVTDTTYNGNRAFDPLSAAGAGSTMQELYFCEPHYHVAKRHTRNMNKNDLWAVLKYVHEARVLRRARGQMNSGRIGYGGK